MEEHHNLYLDDLIVPMYLLIPKTSPPYKAILAFHGHGIGVRQILGHYADDDITEQMIANDENFAQQLVEAGYLVCAIEQRGFGERVAERVSDNANSCQQLAFQYLMTGKTLLGERVRDATASLNYLLSRDDIDSETIGCTGHSGGGTTALFLAAIDSRIDVSVVSGYFCDYRESILGVRHCECNYVPDLLKLGNIAEIAALIAPRSLCFINGERDHIFPIQGVYQSYDKVKHAYQLLDAASQLSLVTHPDEHRYDVALSRAWFDVHMLS